jgi:cell division protein ZapA
MSQTVDIKLCGRVYAIACPPQERAGLLDAAAFLDARMQDFAVRTGSGGERLATMTALNLAHELLLLQRKVADSPPTLCADDASRRRMEEMASRLDKLLSPDLP